MNYQQVRKLGETAQEVADLRFRLDALESRYSAMCEVFELLMNRKHGRPTRAEVERLEQLHAKMNGATH